MILKILLLVSAFFAGATGIGILNSDNCATVSFDGEGGGRVVRAVCYADSSGALPAWLAGLGMIGIAGALIAVVFLAFNR
jgi:hypothetical protein